MIYGIYIKLLLFAKKLSIMMKRKVLRHFMGDISFCFSNRISYVTPIKHMLRNDLNLVIKNSGKSDQMLHF